MALAARDSDDVAGAFAELTFGKRKPDSQGGGMRRPIGLWIRKARAHPKTLLLMTLLLPVLLVCAMNLWIVKSTDSRVFKDSNALPENDVALVLGTASTLSGGVVNPHFAARMEAAAHLYRNGKVKHLLVSGDNHTRGYDEPTNMKEALVKLGVPESAITMDYAGFRTLDSVVRAKEVFGLGCLTIITDDFHVNRALFLCRHYGINAVAYSSEEVSFGFSANTRFREVGARVKAVMDIYLLNTQPRFLGEKIEISL
jgi:SanA protein